MSTATDCESTALFNPSSGNHRATYGTNGKTRANGQYKPPSQRWRLMIAVGVVFLMCVVFVFVRAAVTILQTRRMERQYDGCASLDQTGRSMIVPVYQSMMRDIHRLFPNTTTLSNMIEPSEVEELRKSILRVRDLIDIYSPIFPNRSSVSSPTPATLENLRNPAQGLTKLSVVEVDIWSIFRAHLDAGYTIIGQYQDLDHSHINYTMQLSHRLRREVLQWKNQFIRNTTTLMLITCTNTSLSEISNSSDVFLQFLHIRHDDNHQRRTPGYTHRTESRLFWRSVDPHPHLDDCACSSLQRLVQKQLHTTRHYYHRAFAHDSVADEAAHTDVQYVHCLNSFHSRKRFDPHTAMYTFERGNSNLRKILRCWIDEYNLLASYCDGSQNRRTIFPKNRTYVDALNSGRQLLGRLNDDWNAYTYYTTRKYRTATTHDGNSTYQATIERWRQKVDADWDAFRSWSLNESFSDMIDVMLQE
jgi:hypothetical protein